MKKMTLEEAMQRGAEWQEEYEIAKQAYINSKTPQTFSRLKEAELAVKWYYGDYEYAIIRDEKGKPKLDEDGRFLRDTGMLIVHDIGTIKRLMKNEKAHEEYLRNRTNVGKRFLDRSFESFDLHRDKEAYESAVKYANRANELLGMSKNGLILTGKTGSGKTHLAASIATRINNTYEVLFGTFSEHLERLREEIDKDEHKKYLATMKTVPFLVIDDLGQEKKTEWTQNVLYDVINYRYEHMLPVIITTNFTMSELGNYLGTPIFSRLYEMCAGIQTKGDDYRRTGESK